MDEETQTQTQTTPQSTEPAAPDTAAQDSPSSPERNAQKIDAPISSPVCFYPNKKYLT